MAQGPVLHSHPSRVQRRRQPCSRCRPMNGPGGVSIAQPPEAGRARRESTRQAV
ncbi:Unknown protein sequence [Pseudomonas coronafaciens pv. oryzae]|nr:Unknown protein sequence [Pseudomonas coronafaciens pv. oryzae]